jgi:hypothetical protein
MSTIEEEGDLEEVINIVAEEEEVVVAIKLTEISIMVVGVRVVSVVIPVMTVDSNPITPLHQVMVPMSLGIV